MKQIATALLKAQSEMSNPVKGSSNPFFKSKYADLNSVREAVIPVLNANGIVVLQPMATIDGKNYIKTLFVHESGEQIESLTEIIYSKTNDAQAQGSGITYARRYGLQSLACVGADDDDGNKASEPPKGYKDPKEQPKAKPKSVPTFDMAGTEELLKSYDTKEKVAAHWKANVPLHSNHDYVDMITKRGNELKQK